MESGNYSRSGRIGRFEEPPVAGEIVRAFVPPPPPPESAIDILTLLPLVSSADRAVGRLDGITALLPRPEHIAYIAWAAIKALDKDTTEKTTDAKTKHERKPRKKKGEKK